MPQKGFAEAKHGTVFAPQWHESLCSVGPAQAGCALTMRASVEECARGSGARAVARHQVRRDHKMPSLRMLATMIFCGSSMLLAPAAWGTVVSSLDLLDRPPIHNPGLGPALEYEWGATVGTFVGSGGRVNYADFVAHDGSKNGLRQVYTVGFNEMADNARWAEYVSGTTGENTITLDGPAGFVGELHTKAYSPSGYNVIGRAHAGSNIYEGARDASTYKSAVGDLVADDQKFWLSFTSTTHDVLGIALISSDGYYIAGGGPDNDAVNVTFRYRQGGFGGNLLLSTTDGTRFSNTNSTNNFMGYVNLDCVDTLEIDLSTSPADPGSAFRFDEVAIIVQQIEMHGDSSAVPESGVATLLLAGLGLACRRRR